MTMVAEKSPIIQIVKSKTKLKAKSSIMGVNLLLILIGSLLLAVSAQYKVPLGPVPITLQSMVVMLIATMYGWRLGAATIVAYWTEGILIGGIYSFLPWFANGSGLAYFMGAPSAGFLWGFLPMVLVIGYLTHNHYWQKSFFSTSLALIVGQLVLYFFGLTYAYFAVLPFVDWMSTPYQMLSIYLYPFVIGDMLKTMIATLITVLFIKNIGERT